MLLSNQYTINLKSLKSSGVANSTLKYLESHHQPTTVAATNAISVLNAAAHAQSKRGQSDLKEILPLLEKRPNDIGLILTVIQLYALVNNYGSAIALLENFFQRLEQSTTTDDLDVRFAPGLVGVAVSLYKKQGRKSRIKAELAKAASYWNRKSKPPPTLLRAAGTPLLESSRAEDLAQAREIYDALRQQDPNDRFAIAGYIASHAFCKGPESLPDLDKITPIARLVAGVDASALESAGVARLPTSATAESKKRTVDDSLKPAKKRQRKSRLPKDFDPNKKPDPERWLPLRDRSSYRPKGKKGKAKQAALTQGGVSKEDEVAEHSGSAGVVRPEKGGAGQGKNEKKKGKR